MTVEDVDQVAQIESTCFPRPWSRKSFLDEVTTNEAARYLVVREDGDVVAYAGVWLVIDEGHITNIAVRPDRQGMGYGEMVTRALIQMAADCGMVWMTLEVRRSNERAQALYHKLGFIDVGYRKRYYENTEDALIMALEHMPQGDPEHDPLLVRE
ncbi:MAG: ribosomal-protein-alanine N-acetyltransferase [Clostridiales bacterium]|nr:ribosomal-protein-alanine N-acetyltransferase [Clostridiales bacterium]